MYFGWRNAFQLSEALGDAWTQPWVYGQFKQTRVGRNGTIRLHRTNSVEFWGVLPPLRWMLLLFGGVCICSVHIFTILMRVTSRTGNTSPAFRFLRLFPIQHFLWEVPHGARIRGIFPAFSLGFLGRNGLWVKSGGNRLTCFISFLLGKKTFFFSIS